MLTEDNQIPTNQTISLQQLVEFLQNYNGLLENEFSNPYQLLYLKPPNIACMHIKGKQQDYLIEEIKNPVWSSMIIRNDNNEESRFLIIEMTIKLIYLKEKFLIRYSIIPPTPFNMEWLHLFGTKVK